jgi:hypothetical protein
VELNSASAVGIVTGRHASALLLLVTTADPEDVLTGVETGGEAGGAVAADCAALETLGPVALEVAAALAVVPLPDEPSDWQPPRAVTRETHTNTAQVLRSVSLYAIAALFAVRRKRSALAVVPCISKSRRQHLATCGNPAICNPQTGSFAPPPFGGFALENEIS